MWENGWVRTYMDAQHCIQGHIGLCFLSRCRRGRKINRKSILYRYTHGEERALHDGVSQPKRGIFFVLRPNRAGLSDKNSAQQKQRATRTRPARRREKMGSPSSRDIFINLFLSPRIPRHYHRRFPSHHHQTHRIRRAALAFLGLIQHFRTIL